MHFTPQRRAMQSHGAGDVLVEEGHAAATAHVPLYADVSYETEVDRNMNPGVSEVYVIMIRRLLAVLYFIMGVGQMAAYLMSDDQCLKLSRQVTDPDDVVGRTNTVGVSKSAGPWCPPFVNALAMLASSLFMVATSSLPYLSRRYIGSMDMFTNSWHWVQLTVQGAAIVAIVLPLVGVINVFELIFATLLTGSMYVVFSLSDELNASCFAHREWSKIENRIGNKYTSAQKAGGRFRSYLQATISFWSRLHWFGLFLYAAIWGVSLYHAGQSISSRKVDAGFVAIFFIVAIFQMAVPIVKMLFVYECGPFCKNRTCCLILDVTHLFSFLVIFIGLTFG